MVNVREYILEDIKDIILLQKKLNQHHIEIDAVFYQPSTNASEEFGSYITSRFKDEDFKIYVAEYEDKIVGYIMGWINVRPPIYVRKKVGYLSNVYINPEMRGKGIGGKLVSKLNEWFLSKDVDFIETHADARNINTVSSFKSLGFSELNMVLFKKVDK